MKYIFRSDLAIEKKNLKNINSEHINNINIKRFKDNNYEYTNILFNNIEVSKVKKDLISVLKEEIKLYMKKYNLTNKSSCLVVGLGNDSIISDSIGPKVVAKVKATGYISRFSDNSFYRDVYTFIPRVLEDTGMMALDSIKAITKEIKPDFIIVVDAILSGSVKYLERLIQITDIGITPGSGISNYQSEISINSLGVPIIVIGVPTVVEASTIIKDVLKVKDKFLEYKKGYDLIVSSKNIDIYVNIISDIISDAINKTLNKFKKI